MAELGEVVLFVIVGLVVGIAIVFVFMQSRVSKKAESLYQQKKTELESQMAESRRLADSLYEQRKSELETDIERRKAEIDESIRNQISSEFETWKAEYVVQHGTEVEERIKAEVTRSVNSSRSALKGKINEQIAPLFPEFASKYIAADARFIGSPIDFIVFKNLHTLSAGVEEQKPVEIVFVEVKTGKSSMNRNERAVKTAVENLRVSYDLLKVSVDGEPAPTVEIPLQEPAPTETKTSGPPIGSGSAGIYRSPI